MNPNHSIGAEHMEGTNTMTEQFVFDHVSRDGTALDWHKRRGTTPVMAVYMARSHLFARPPTAQ